MNFPEFYVVCDKSDIPVCFCNWVSAQDKHRYLRLGNWEDLLLEEHRPIYVRLERGQEGDCSDTDSNHYARAKLIASPLTDSEGGE